jgi:hypothetical protein
MNLKSFPSLDRGASSTRAHPHQMGQHKLINRSIVASLLSLVAMATVSQPEKAAAIDLSFGTSLDATNVATPGGLNLGAAYNGATMRFINVATGIDARITATAFGANYSYAGTIPDYYSVNGTTQPNGDLAPIYQIAANQLGAGGLTYRIDLFATDGTTHNFSTAYVAPDLRFSVYDVDGENPTTTGAGTTQSAFNQSEAVRVFKGTASSGFAGYQVGSASNALIPTEDATSYLFSGRSVNQLETSPLGATLLYFQNTSSVTFQFEANTTSPVNTTATNPVFSAIDGDVSLIGQTSTNFDSNGHATPAAGFGTYQVATKIPEPFSIIGSLIGGGVAFGMRKKLKATSK